MKLIWGRYHDVTIKFGVYHGVLYPKNSPGVVWNGLISVEETESPSDVVVGYYDGEAYYREQRAGGWTGKVSALTFPDVLYSPDEFGFSYRAGNEIHIIYNAMASSFEAPALSEKKTLDPSIFTWNLVTTPVQVPGMKASSHFVIDAEAVYSGVLEDLEALLYGTDTTDPRLPPPEELLDIFEAGSMIRIIDNGDGTWTAIGPPAYVYMTDYRTFEITSPTAVYLDDHTYKISSW
jgi:hypothetical protein